MAVRWHSSLGSCNYHECIFAVTSLLIVQVPDDLQEIEQPLSASQPHLVVSSH